MTLILPHLDLAKGISRDRENQRLEELYSMGVLDRSSDERFVRYTELAARSLQAPIAAVVLVDRDRLVFKAVHGRVSRQVRRDASFAAHAMRQGEQLLLVENALEDERFCTHPLVSGEPFG